MAGRAVNAIQRFVAGQKIHHAAGKILDLEGKAPEAVQKPARRAALSAYSAQDASERGDKPAAKKHAAESRRQADAAKKAAARYKRK